MQLLLYYRPSVYLSATKLAEAVTMRLERGVSRCVLLISFALRRRSSDTADIAIWSDDMTSRVRTRRVDLHTTSDRILQTYIHRV